MTDTYCQVYVSGALNGIDPLSGLREFYEAIGQTCEKVGLPAYIPHQHTDPIAHATITPDVVYAAIDRSRVLEAQVVVAYVGRPSLGVGMELAWTVEANKVLILLYEETLVPTRLVLGIPNAVHIKFDTQPQALDMLQELLQKLLDTGALHA